jgi:Flp pilus assembly CpaF family ATPase
MNPFLDVGCRTARLNATLAVVERPVLSLRLYRLEKVLLDRLRARHTFTEELGIFLSAAVRGRFNIMVSGETFAGKTTLLRALGNEIGPEERWSPPSTSMSLASTAFPRCIRRSWRWRSGWPTARARGITMADLVRSTLRMNPDRVIVGEVVGAEVLVMLTAMRQGNNGSLSLFMRGIRAASTGSPPMRCVAAVLPVEASYRLPPAGRLHRA